MATIWVEDLGSSTHQGPVMYGWGGRRRNWFMRAFVCNSSAGTVNINNSQYSCHFIWEVCVFPLFLSGNARRNEALKQVRLLLQPDGLGTPLFPI